LDKDLRFVDYFLFTQHSLATFKKCPLKFKKRYMENLKWDSIPDEVIKKNLQIGNDFHLLANRYFSGIDTGVEEEYYEKTGDHQLIELSELVENLKENFKLKPDYKYFPEHKLRIVNEKIKLEANFDLIILKEDSLEIWDWKTKGIQAGKTKKRDASRFKDSLQTKVYLFVLKEMSQLIAGKEIEAENIVMHYWQPDPPEILVSIPYSDSMHKETKTLIEEEMNAIYNYNYDEFFDKKNYEKHCIICEFNWFCNNKKMDINKIREEFLIDELDFDDIEEIEF
jgi:CRISPR/Cas system-associated exonuclease Cas4 (RecB family)